jgi:hypothetical protein
MQFFFFIIAFLSLIRVPLLCKHALDSYTKHIGCLLSIGWNFLSIILVLQLRHPYKKVHYIPVCIATSNLCIQISLIPVIRINDPPSVH